MLFARVERDHEGGEQLAIFAADYPTTRPEDIAQTPLSPKLGLTFRLRDDLTAYFQYAHGFRSPPLEDVNIGLELPLFNVRAIPNPDLEPERSNGYELGLRWRPAAVAIDASVYYNDYTDFIESKVNLGPEPGTGVVLFQSQNLAEARIHGVELEATVDGASIADAVRGWSLRLAAAWAEGRDEVRDQPLNSVDPPSAVLQSQKLSFPTRTAKQFPRGPGLSMASMPIRRTEAFLPRTNLSIR